MAIVINLDVGTECHLQSAAMPAGRFIGVPRLEPVTLQEFANVHPFFTFELQRLYADITVGTSELDRKSTRLNSSHVKISYAVFCLKKKKKKKHITYIYKLKETRV